MAVVRAKTPFCVDTTVRRALSLDSGVVVATAAHPTGGGGPLAPEAMIAHHNATLADLPQPTREVTVVAAAIAFW